MPPVTPKSNIEIARNARLRPILDLARDRLGIGLEHLIPYGHYKAKLTLEYIRSLSGRSDGKLILVTSTSPTPAGEGKTTTTVGLGDALNRVGKRAMIALREPSLGPCLGMKGGAAGGGYAQVVPMEDINLHFTGDFHAISAANNLLAALADNHIYWGNELGIDPGGITWRRATDMNDRALRTFTCSRGGKGEAAPQEAHFDITAASEVMTILCLAEDLDDLHERLGNIIVGRTRDKAPVRARDLTAEGAMTVLLKDALQPNLVQTLENNPALVHGGPFANIAHGCNSVVATKAALKLADYVVTEAGFGADLGAEKFFDIKCRKAGLTPACAVMVTTVRALKMHGGVDRKDLGEENCTAVTAGLPNLLRHVRNVEKFGVPVVVAVNTFLTDTAGEIDVVRTACAGWGVAAVTCDHWARGGAGAEDLARAVVDLAGTAPGNFRFLYDDSETLWNKAQIIAREIYGAEAVSADPPVRERFDFLQKSGFGLFPVCMAKTQYSFSADPRRLGAPSNHVVPIRELRLSAGAEIAVVVCGDIMTMPGLPRVPAATGIRIDEKGLVEGLF
jgi:formate--tetrahydrofolate ligase